MKKKIFYVTHIDATFIRKDTDFLSKKYDLIFSNFHIQVKLDIIFQFIKQLWLLVFNFYKADLVLCQFCGYHSFLPSLFAKIFRKPNVIIACGTDSFSYPSISYGNFRKFLLGYTTRKSYEWATHIVPVHESLILSNSDYYEIEQKQGILYFCPKVRAKFVTIFNGYDTNIFSENEQFHKRPKTFITIGKNIETKPVFYRKGIDLILELAKELPDCTFFIVGMNDKAKMPNAPDNVTYIEFLPQEGLSKLLNESQFYLQLSIAEGFPNALCEAMLCGCVPIGSNVAGIPQIIENTGFLLKKKDVNLLKKLVINALNSPLEELGKKAKDRIIKEFSLERRKKEYYQLIDSLIKDVKNLKT